MTNCIVILQEKPIKGFDSGNLPVDDNQVPNLKGRKQDWVAFMSQPY